MIIQSRVCDLPDHPAIDFGDAVSREFSLDGHDYQIDLCPDHDQQFMDTADRWAQAARPSGRPLHTPTNRTRAARDRTAAIRKWAIEQGKIGEARGRMPVDVVAEWEGLHQAGAV